MSRPRFAVGIDLGTTHSALAAAPLSRPTIQLLRVPQFVAPGEVSERELLPSFLYLAIPGEMNTGELNLPWGATPQITGELARRLGAKAPDRLVASAKSWICHGGVNRRAKILPWGSNDDDPHVSPYEAQVAYLSHLERAWRHKYPAAPLSEQDVVVTVPASFDEGARSLTAEAALEAGLGEVRLLEEPQAALYDYLGTHAEPEQAAQLRTLLAAAKLILVVDIGGGTTDLTLLRVLSELDDQGQPRVERIAVGGHLMLGGDNMDAALALYALEKAGLGRPEDATVWAGLVQSARDTKERLLSDGAPTDAVISYQGRGSRLTGSTKSLVVTREEALAVLLDGFFPKTDPADVAVRGVRAGLTTLGLPYTSDTAVPRHLATFLRRHAAAAIEAGATLVDGLPKPDLLLLNGGVFKAPAAVERLQEVLGRWYRNEQVQLLKHVSLDTSVARGAARFALARRGIGTLISGGTARAYYVGIEHAGRPCALCLAPKNAAEGTRHVVDGRVLELRLNEPVSFPLFAYSGDRLDAPGTLLAANSEGAELESLPALQTLLRAKSSPSGNVRPGSAGGSNTVRVTLESSIDQSGALQLSLVTVALPPTRWKLDFVLRGTSLARPVAPASAPAADARRGEPATATGPTHPKLPECRQRIKSAFASYDDSQVKSLRNQLEAVLGPRGEWSGETCRGIFDACMNEQAQRGHGEAHELNWLRLCSWTLRPGFGVVGDEERLTALWNLRSVGTVL
ncbi:MAG: hypothetical protein RJA70_4953, partial [Pseudomonadota bacterium]